MAKWSCRYFLSKEQKPKEKDGLEQSVAVRATLTPYGAGPLLRLAMLCPPPITPTIHSYAKELFELARSNSKKPDLVFEKEKLLAKIKNIEKQIEATAERISELPRGIDAKPFYDQILKLQNAKTSVENEFTALKNQAVNTDEPLDYSEFQEFAKGLIALLDKADDPEVQAAICRKLIHRIEVTPEGIIIRYHVGKSHYLGMMDEKSGSLDFKNKNEKDPVEKNLPGRFKSLSHWKNTRIERKEAQLSVVRTAGHLVVRGGLNSPTHG